jgi:hypothetical protein
MIRVTPETQIHFPVLSLARDKSVAQYKDEQELTTAIGKGNSSGRTLPGYLGMKIIDQEGNLFEVREAISGRDLGSLYPGFSLSRIVFRTRRMEANLGLSALGNISLDETRHLVADLLPSIRRTLTSAGFDAESLPASVNTAVMFQELFSLLDPRQTR